METVVDPVVGTTTYAYDAVGNRDTLEYPNGNFVDWNFDDLNRLTDVTNFETQGGNVLSSYTYTLGNAGNRLSVTENTGRAIAYIYDDLYRLTNETATSSPDVNADINHQYVYDLVGNRLEKITASDTTTYAYSNNDLLNTETHSVDGTTTYTYDENGSTLTRTKPSALSTYSYTWTNRLESATTGSQSVSYQYDTDGLRTKQVVNGTDVTEFLVDKNRNFGQVLEERDDIGSLLAEFTHGDDLISQSRAGTSFYLYDGQMSTRQLSDAVGAISDTYTYDAYGEDLSSTGSSTNDYKYTGEQQDANTGFYYLRARYLNTSVGRFHTQDSFLGSDLEPQSLHKYLYAHTNPVGNLDPSGRFSLVETLGAAAIMASWGAFSLQIANIVNIDGVSRYIGSKFENNEKPSAYVLSFAASALFGGIGGGIGGAVSFELLYIYRLNKWFSYFSAGGASASGFSAGPGVSLQAGPVWDISEPADYTRWYFTSSVTLLRTTVNGFVNEWIGGNRRLTDTVNGGFSVGSSPFSTPSTGISATYFWLLPNEAISDKFNEKGFRPPPPSASVTDAYLAAIEFVARLAELGIRAL